MTTPIVLKAADVLAAARKAYDEKRLSAQGPTPMCKYRDRSGLPCAIGAALTDEDARRFDHAEDMGIAGSGVMTLSDARLLTLDDGVSLSTLQIAHDNWCDARNLHPTSKNAVAAENDLRKLIGLDPLPVEG